MVKEIPSRLGIESSSNCIRIVNIRWRKGATRNSNRAIMNPLRCWTGSTRWCTSWTSRVQYWFTRLSTSHSSSSLEGKWITLRHCLHNSIRTIDAHRKKSSTGSWFVEGVEPLLSCSSNVKGPVKWSNVGVSERCQAKNILTSTLTTRS